MQKTVLAHEFWGDNQYFASLRPRTGGTEPVTFVGAQSSLGGHGPGMPPVASGLLQVYSNLSNYNYRIFVKEILLEIGFIEEIRTI